MVGVGARGFCSHLRIWARSPRDMLLNHQFQLIVLQRRISSSPSGPSELRTFPRFSRWHTTQDASKTPGTTHWQVEESRFGNCFMERKPYLDFIQWFWIVNVWFASCFCVFAVNEGELLQGEAFASSFDAVNLARAGHQLIWSFCQA